MTALATRLPSPSTPDPLEISQTLDEVRRQVHAVWANDPARPLGQEAR